jgi:hypothetical protein
MPTRRFKRIALAQLLLSGCAAMFGVCILIEHAQAQPGYVPPSYVAASARFKSIQSRYCAAAELQTHCARDTKRNTFNTKHRSK